MLSRVADSIYWMARYIERAENMARFIDVKLSLVLDQPTGLDAQWESLVSITGDNEYFNKKYGVADRESVVWFLTFDRDYPNSIIRCVHAARENARSVSETISSEMWEQLNEFYHWIDQGSKGREPLDSPYEFFRRVKQHSHLFTGITDATMSRGLGWHFANLGRMLERADKVSRIVDVKYFTLLRSPMDVNTSLDDLQWSSVLRAASGFEMYRKMYHGVAVHDVVDFLLLNREFPRAIHHCVIEADRSLHAVSRTPSGAFSNLAERRLGQLRAELAYTDAETVLQRGLHEFIDDLQVSLNQVGEAIYERFFALTPVSSLVPTASATQVTE